MARRKTTSRPTLAVVHRWFEQWNGMTREGRKSLDMSGIR